MTFTKTKTGQKPHVRIFKFKEDFETKIFTMYEGDSEFKKVPKELFIESIRHPETIKAETLIRGRERMGGRYKFQTGLRRISSLLYYGDYFEVVNGKPKKSFILICYSTVKDEMTMHFFNNFFLYPRSRGKFITNYLKSCS